MRGTARYVLMHLGAFSLHPLIASTCDQDCPEGRYLSLLTRSLSFRLGRYSLAKVRTYGSNSAGPNSLVYRIVTMTSGSMFLCGVSMSSRPDSGMSEPCMGGRRIGPF